MAFQIPKTNHPWRQYQNRTKDNPDTEVHPTPKKTIQTFLLEMATSWDRIEIYTTVQGREDRHYLKDLPSYKQAGWIVSLIRKNYL